jgi:hypothetical protein
MDQNQNQENDLFNFDNQAQQPEPPAEKPPVVTGDANEYPAPEPYQPEAPEAVQEYIPPVPPPPTPTGAATARPSSNSSRIWLIVAIILVVLCCCCLLILAGTYLWLGDIILCQLDPSFCR